MKKYIVDGTHLKLISTAQIPEMRMGPGFTVKANADGSLLSCYTNTRPTFFQIFDAEGSAVLDCLAGSSIQSMFWDAEDPRVFAIQIKDDTKIKAYFISPNQVIESKIILPATVPGELFGLLIPWMLFHSNDAITNEIILAYRGLIACKEKDLKSVTGVCLVLESSDGKSRRDLMRLLKNIEGEPTWLQLAQIFIEYSKYEMAKYCFGKIKNVKALRTITYQCEIGRNTNLKEQYRIHLGNYARAIEIPAKTNDFAQLSENFQSLALWDKAFNIAANSDISLLETTYYNFAMHLQERGDYGGAIAAFEKSNANAAEIPRMIMSHNGDLQAYLKSTDKIDAIIWWAQNAESHGDFDTALEYYKRANDVLSLARIYCLTGEIQKAVDLSMAHPDSKSIFYLIAKYFEREGNHKEAIDYYIRSNSFSCGLRIALINRMDQEVLQLALQCSAFHMKEAANHFEDCGKLDNAILLFTKAKAYNKAIQLCISTNNTSAIEKILENIEASGNHTLLALLQSMRRKENQENELYK